MTIEMVGDFVGAIMIIMLVSLLFRKIIIRFLKCNDKTASTISCVTATVILGAAAFTQTGQIATICYPLGGLVVWFFLFYELPLFNRSGARK
jgi:hypothetical protein